MQQALAPDSPEKGLLRRENTQEGTRAYHSRAAETFLPRTAQIQGRVYICKCKVSIKIH